MKQCKKCGYFKDISEYRKQRNVCKVCNNELAKKYRKENPDIVKGYSERYYKKHPKNNGEINRVRRENYAKNPEKYKNVVKAYRDNHKDAVKSSVKKYYEKNKIEIAKYHQEYRKNNKEKRKQWRKNYEKRKAISKDWKLRKIVSNAIYCALNRNGNKKMGSILSFLPYTMIELKKHLESLFEPWMNWDNWGIYDPLIWDDNDVNTWTWHIDHIVPKSTFIYSSMGDEEFKKCWALENLRPYSSKLNISENNIRLKMLGLK